MFKANPTSVFNLSVQIKKLSLSRNKIGNSGAQALATCLWNIDELDLERCDITECEELCNAIQSLKRPVSFNLVSKHTVLKFVWYASVKICSWLLSDVTEPCGKYFTIVFDFYSTWSNYWAKNVVSYSLEYVQPTETYTFYWSCLCSAGPGPQCFLSVRLVPNESQSAMRCFQHPHSS